MRAKQAAQRTSGTGSPKSLRLHSEGFDQGSDMPNCALATAFRHPPIISRVLAHQGTMGHVFMYYRPIGQ